MEYRPLVVFVRTSKLMKGSKNTRDSKLARATDSIVAGAAFSIYSVNNYLIFQTETCYRTFI